MSFLARLSSDRASIILETALCLPLYFVLLIFLVDVPQIMAHRQSLLGVARLDADVKARYIGYAPMITEDLCKRLFWNQSNQILSVEFMDVQHKDAFDYGTKSKLAEGINNKNFFQANHSNSFFDRINLFTGNIFEDILSGGSLRYFLDEIFATDVFYWSRPRVAINTVLPQEFYAVVMNLERDKNLYVVCPCDCWQPSGNSAQEARQTVFGNVGEIINTAIGWVTSLVGLPNLDFSD